jgi:hypothetical protein
MLISTGDSGAAVNGPGSILAGSAGASRAAARVPPAGFDYYSTNMPKLLKNLYNGPREKARGSFA